MDFDIAHMWSQMNALVKMVVIVLTLQGIGTVYVTIDRLIMLFLSNKKSRIFAAEAGAKLARGDYDEVVAIATEHEGSHLANFVETGLSVFVARREDGHGREKSAELASRAAADTSGEANNGTAAAAQPKADASNNDSAPDSSSNNDNTSTTASKKQFLEASAVAKPEPRRRPTRP